MIFAWAVSLTEIVEEDYRVTEIVADCSALGAQTVTRPFALLTTRYFELFTVAVEGSDGIAVR